MMADSTDRWHRLALLAPACGLWAVALCILIAGGAWLQWVVLAALVAACALFSLYAVAGATTRSPWAYVLLGVVAAFAALALFYGMTLAIATSTGGLIPAWGLAVELGVPLAVLIAGGLIGARRGQPSLWLVGALWLAFLGAGLASPGLASLMTDLLGNDAIAAIAVLFAPSLAAAMWIGAETASAFAARRSRAAVASEVAAR